MHRNDFYCSILRFRNFLLKKPNKLHSDKQNFEKFVCKPNIDCITRVLKRANFKQIGIEHLIYYYTVCEIVHTVQKIYMPFNSIERCIMNDFFFVWIVQILNLIFRFWQQIPFTFPRIIHFMKEHNKISLCLVPVCSMLVI